MRKKRVVWSAVILSAALVLFAVLDGRGVQVAHAANCAGKCYGIQWWGGADAAQTNISIEQATCQSCGSSNEWFVNRSLWLTDDSSWAQTNCSNLGACWVEIGVNISGNGAPFYNCASGALADCYYEADNRPCSLGYNEYFGNLASHDYGHIENQAIMHVANGSQGYGHVCPAHDDDWQVISNSWYFGNGKGVSYYSDYNPMLPTGSGGEIQIGTEIYGLANTLPQTDWTYNYYGFLNSGGTITWSPQNSYNQSNQTVIAPVVAWWTTPPTGNSTGGDWTGYCTSS